MHKHTAATKPITFDDDDDDDSNSNSNVASLSLYIFLYIYSNGMIIIVGFGLIAAHFILANDIRCCCIRAAAVAFHSHFCSLVVFNSIHTYQTFQTFYKALAGSLCVLFISLDARVQSR